MGSQPKNEIQQPALLLAAVMLGTVIACLTSTIACAAALTLATAKYAIQHDNLRKTASRLIKANIFIIFMWLIVPFTGQGEPITHVLSIPVSNAGLKLCFLITLKANAIMLVFISLMNKFSMFELGQTLAVFKCPSEIAWLFLLMECNVSILRKEWNRLSTAAKLRGFMPTVSWHSYSTYGNMLGLLLIRAHERGIAMHEAMLLAGYSGRFPFKGTWHPNKIDMLFLLKIIATCVILCLLNHFC